MTGFGGAIKNIGMAAAPRGQEGSAQQREADDRPTTVPRLPPDANASVRTTRWRLTGNEKDARHDANCVGSEGHRRLQLRCHRVYGRLRALTELNGRMAEYAKALFDGRPNFHISLVVGRVAQLRLPQRERHAICRTWALFASFDPLALDSGLRRRVPCRFAAAGKPAYGQHWRSRGFHDHHDHSSFRARFRVARLPRAR
jgi:hypothetical protein